MRYADQKNIAIVVMAGETELQNQSFTVKDMRSGVQKSVDAAQLLPEIQQLLENTDIK